MLVARDEGEIAHYRRETDAATSNVVLGFGDELETRLVARVTLVFVVAHTTAF